MGGSGHVGQSKRVSTYQVIAIASLSLLPALVVTGKFVPQHLPRNRGEGLAEQPDHVRMVPGLGGGLWRSYGVSFNLQPGARLGSGGTRSSPLPFQGGSHWHQGQMWPEQDSTSGTSVLHP